MYKGAFHTIDHWPLMTVPVPGVLAGGVVAVIPSAVGVGVATGAGAKVGGDGPIAHVGTGLTIGAGATVKEGAKVFDSVKEGEEVC